MYLRSQIRGPTRGKNAVEGAPVLVSDEFFFCDSSCRTVFRTYQHIARDKILNICQPNINCNRLKRMGGRKDIYISMC